MNPIIIVHGDAGIGPTSAEMKAKAIAHYYDVQCRQVQGDRTSWEVDVNDQLKRGICYDEDTCQESLNEINAAMDVNIVVDDLEF